MEGDTSDVCFCLSLFPLFPLLCGIFKAPRFKQRVSGVRVGVQNFKITNLMIKLSRGSGPKYISEFKKTVRSISGTITTVQNEVKELSKKYVDLETQTQGMSNIFDNVRSECSDKSKAIKELLESGSFGLSVP
jgi:archaellum component FlaC